MPRIAVQKHKIHVGLSILRNEMPDNPSRLAGHLGLNSETLNCLKYTLPVANT